MLMTIQVAKAAAAVVFGAAMLLEPGCSASNNLNFESLVTTGDVVSTQFKLLGSEFYPVTATDPLLVVTRRDAPSQPNVMQVSGGPNPSVLVTMPAGAYKVHVRVAVDATSIVHLTAYGPGITEIGRTAKQIEAGAGFAELESEPLNGPIQRISIRGDGSRAMYIDDLVIDWREQ